MSSLPKWIQEIKNRADKATEGSWTTCRFTKEHANAPGELGIYWRDAPGNSINGDGSLHVCLICRGMDGPTKEANSQFIAHAREDVPKLIEMVTEMAVALEVASEFLDSDIGMVQAALRKYYGEDEDG